MIICLKSKKLNSILDSNEIVITDDTIHILLGGHTFEIKHSMSKDDLMGQMLNDTFILDVDDTSGDWVLMGVMKCVGISPGETDKAEGN